LPCKKTLAVATLAALALSALAALLAALSGLLLLLTRLLLAAALLAALTAHLVLLSTLLTTLILLARLLFVGVHICSFDFLPGVTTSALKRIPEAGLYFQLLLMAATHLLASAVYFALLRGSLRVGRVSHMNKCLANATCGRRRLDEKRNVRARQSARFFRPNEFGCGNANDSVQRVKIGSGAVPSRDEANRAR
jgi:hypothetical protein